MDIVNSEAHQGGPTGATVLNLVFVIDSLAGGGAELVVLRLISALTSLGHNVRLVSINPTVSYSIQADIKVFFVNKASVKKGIKYFYYRRTAVALQEVLEDLNKMQPIHALVSNLPETDRIVHYVNKYPILYCIHSNFYHAYIQSKKSPLKRFLKTKQLQRLYNRKHLIFVSNGAQQDAQQYVGIRPKSSRTIYNPFPIEEIRKLAEDYSVGYRDYFIHVGRFNRVKRHDKLLQLYAESGVANHLLLLGEGNVEQTEAIYGLIRQYDLEGKVIVCEFSQNPFPYIRHAIALLLTSDHEGLSNVIIESLICGTPVIAYDCPSGPREILGGKLQEFLIPFDDSNAFVSKLKQVSQDRPRISSDIAALDRFEEVVIAKKYINAINEVISGRR
jgi:glycosyltransferase involved in cell wall biosynthesis